jgi:hypothetical protein
LSSYLSLCSPSEAFSNRTRFGRFQKDLATVALGLYKDPRTR